MDLDTVKRAISESTELSKQGNNQRALKILDESIADAIRENHDRWVRVLSRHASVISDSMADLDLIRHYAEQTLAYGPDSATAFYGLADVLFRQGETPAAERYARKAYELSINGDNEIDRALVEMIVKRWPEIKQDDNCKPSGES